MMAEDRGTELGKKMTTIRSQFESMAIIEDYVKLTPTDQYHFLLYVTGWFTGYNQRMADDKTREDLR